MEKIKTKESHHIEDEIDFKMLWFVIIESKIFVILMALAFVENVSYIVAFHRLSIVLGAALGILILNEKLYPLKLLGMLIMLIGLLGVALG